MALRGSCQEREHIGSQIAGLVDAEVSAAVTGPAHAFIPGMLMQFGIQGAVGRRAIRHAEADPAGDGSSPAVGRAKDRSRCPEVANVTPAVEDVHSLPGTAQRRPQVILGRNRRRKQYDAFDAVGWHL